MPEPVELEAALRSIDALRGRPGEFSVRDGESMVDHAHGVVSILASLNADQATQVAGALAFSLGQVSLDQIARRFGPEVRSLVDLVRQVIRLSEVNQRVGLRSDDPQPEVLRRMMLAMASDIRVVLIRLASRLQTLRHCARVKLSPDPAISRETLDVLAPLANRLGLWQLKWELEDLAFRFHDPVAYKRIAGQLEEKRHEREAFVLQVKTRLEFALQAAGIEAEVSGRPKHIYSIHNKMRAKHVTIESIRDLNALRVIVADVRGCYEALGLIHELWAAVPQEYDDYISRPKSNGYQSLHTVVRDVDAKEFEVQIRTRDMHQHAEYGVASHWAYKERVTAPGQPADGTRVPDFEQVAWLRQLLDWQREVSGGGVAETQEASAHSPRSQRIESDRIFALTPQGRVVELPEGATAIDFAYHVHSDLGHRCRGARVDGQMVSLSTPLRNGQTVEIISVRKGSDNDGPSRDWLNPELGFVRSNRARSKVRQWFNAREHERELARGRERIDRVLQREGRTALALPELASRLAFDSVDAMFAATGREELSVRAIEEAVRRDGAASPTPPAPLPPLVRPAQAGNGRASDSGVLVVGVDLLMTQLARCCRPAFPDPIIGFVTRGRGVSIHRQACPTFERMSRAAPERVLETSWGERPAADRLRRFPVDVVVEASDREGLLRDVSDVFARDRLNVIGVNTQSRNRMARMQFTVEVPDIDTLSRALRVVGEIPGVSRAERRGY